MISTRHGTSGRTSLLRRAARIVPFSVLGCSALACVLPGGAVAQVAPVRNTVASDGHPLAVWEKRPAGAVKGVVLLLHGRTWSALPDFDFHAPGENLSLMDGLNERGWVTYALDQRGYGATPRDETGRLTPNRAIADVAMVLRWIREREPSMPVHLFGWSYGSWASHFTAQRHPDLVDRLVLYGYPGPLGQEIPLDEPEGPAPSTPNTAEAAASDFITEGAISQSAVDAYVEAALAADPIYAEWTRRHEWNEADPALVTVPTLIINGVEDPFAPLEAQIRMFEAFANKDKALVLVPGGDHAVLLERPREYFMDQIDTFLEGPPQSSGASQR